MTEKTECRKEFERFAKRLGFSVEAIDNVYADKETHLIWLGYRQAWHSQQPASTRDTVGQ